MRFSYVGERKKLEEKGRNIGKAAEDEAQFAQIRVAQYLPFVNIICRVLHSKLVGRSRHKKKRPFESAAGLATSRFEMAWGWLGVEKSKPAPLNNKGAAPGGRE